MLKNTREHSTYYCLCVQSNSWFLDNQPNLFQSCILIMWYVMKKKMQNNQHYPSGELTCYPTIPLVLPGRCNVVGCKMSKLDYSLLMSKTNTAQCLSLFSTSYASTMMCCCTPPCVKKWNWVVEYQNKYSHLVSNSSKCE